MDGATTRSLFMENTTVVAGLTKGFKLQTFRVQTSKGAEFEYTIENMNEISIPQAIEELRTKTLLRDADVATRTRGVCSNWKQDPPEKSYDHSTAMNCEIVSCFGFEGDKIFVSYHIVLPDGWKMRTGNLSDGYTEEEISNIGKDVSILNADGTKMTGSDILRNDGFYDGDDAVGILKGMTQVAMVRQQRNDTSFMNKRRYILLPFAYYRVSSLVLHLSVNVAQTLSRKERSLLCRLNNTHSVGVWVFCDHCNISGHWSLVSFLDCACSGDTLLLADWTARRLATDTVNKEVNERWYVIVKN